MIVYEGINAEGLKPSGLPGRSPGKKIRMLFLHGTSHGFRTYHDTLRKYVAIDSDIEAVYMAIQPQLWQKILGKSIPLLPRPLDLHAFRHLCLWRMIINRWFHTKLPLEHFDLIHIMTEGSAWSLVDIPKEVPIAKAVNIDATAEQFVQEFGYNRTFHAPVLHAQRQIFDVSDLVVARNPWVIGSLLRDYGLEKDQVYLASNSLECAKSNQNKAILHSDRLLKIAFVGNDFKRKGGNDLLGLFFTSLSGICELHVFSSYIPNEINHQNLYFHSGVSREDLLTSWLPGMDLMVMPTYEDMFPWALIEAASAGLPIISTNMAGIPDIVINGKTGILCKKGDMQQFLAAIHYLLANTDLRIEMGIKAKEHIKRNFNPDTNFQGLIERLKASALSARVGKVN